MSERLRLNMAVEGRDDKGIKKTVCAFLKILHPQGPPSGSQAAARNSCLPPPGGPTRSV